MFVKKPDPKHVVSKSSSTDKFIIIKSKEFYYHILLLHSHCACNSSVLLPVF